MENNNRRALRLPEFWVTDPVAWFAHVEAHFELENLTSQQHRYFNVVKSLSQDSLRLIKDILANPHPTTPYEALKDRLLNNQSLTDFQEIERQFKIWELGPQQKPSELLAHLVELTPADELESKYLIFLLIQRLPKILHMQLGDDLDLDHRDISERADHLWYIHTHDMASSVAAYLFVSVFKPVICLCSYIAHLFSFTLLCIISWSSTMYIFWNEAFFVNTLIKNCLQCGIQTSH
jgi:hypothetical protein